MQYPVEGARHLGGQGGAARGASSLSVTSAGACFVRACIVGYFIVWGGVPDQAAVQALNLV
jgi:hypothetical protein